MHNLHKMERKEAEKNTRITTNLITNIITMHPVGLWKVQLGGSCSASQTPPTSSCFDARSGSSSCGTYHLKL
jgi:hypothetical protein